MYDNFPYSNFHDLNTDWIVKKIKDVETSEANAKASEENAKASEQNAKVSELSAQGFALQANNHAQYAREQAQAAAQSATEANNYVTSTRNQVNLLQSRVDNIIPNQTQTEGNTELIDIRVGYNGVTYPSAGDAVRDQINDIYSLYGEIEITPTWIGNQYINPSTGAYATSSACDRSDFIKVIPESVLVIFSLMRGGAGYAFYDENTAYISGGGGNDTSTSAGEYHTVTVPNNAVYFRFSNFKTYNPTSNVKLTAYIPNKLLLSQYEFNGYTFKSFTDRENLIYSDIYENVSPTINSDKYINNVGAIGSSPLYDLYSFEGENEAIYHIFTCTEFNSQKIIPLAYSDNISYDTRKVAGLVTVQGTGKTIYVNYGKNISSIFGEPVIVKLKTQQKENTHNILQMFNKIKCCGDSITYGLVYTSDTASRRSVVSYPEALQKLTGTETETYATSGFTVSQWWNEYNDDITSGIGILHIIYLGTNGGLTDTVSTDIIGNDYTQYADTNTGNYGKIVRKILDMNQNCVLVKINAGGGSLGVTGTNNVIEQIGTLFGVPVIAPPLKELTDLNYHYWPNKQSYNTVHLNDLGYSSLADQINKEITELSMDDQFSIMPK